MPFTPPKSNIDSNVSDKFEEQLKDIKKLIIPQNFVYTQYPNELPPWELWKFTQMSDWVQLNYNGVFFRSSGGKANIFEGGLQPEQLPNIQGSVGGVMNMYKQYHSGTFYWKNEGNTDYDGDTGQTGVTKFKASLGQTNIDGTFKPENDSTYVDGGEVRPNNMTIQIWKYVS